MQFEVGTCNETESNKFLRSLWAQLRENFGKYSWQYSPQKNGKYNRISFGQIDLGLQEGPIGVSIQYTTRGSITYIIFERYFGQPIDDDYESVRKLRTCVTLARASINHPSPMQLQATIASETSSVSFYQGRNFLILPESDDKFTLMLSIFAYDLVDGQSEYKRNASYILDVIAAATNTSFWQISETLVSNHKKIDGNEVFVEDPDWLDQQDVAQGQLLLSKDDKDFVDVILGSNIWTDEQTLLLNASRHFHNALKLSAESSNLPSYNERQDTVTVLYISALEVVSSIDASKSPHCMECGQPVYKIKKRVSNLIGKNLPDHLVKFVGKFYDDRSKYLHAGSFYSTRDYVGVSLPQLDTSDPTGCKLHLAPTSIMNLKEYTGYCIRREIKAVVIKSTGGNGESHDIGNDSK